MSQDQITVLNQFIIELCETVTQYKLSTVDQAHRPQVIAKSVEAFVDFAYKFFLANYPQEFAEEFINDVLTKGFASVFRMYKYRSGIEYAFKIFKNEMYKFYNT